MKVWVWCERGQTALGTASRLVWVSDTEPEDWNGPWGWYLPLEVGNAMTICRYVAEKLFGKKNVPTDVRDLLEAEMPRATRTTMWTWEEDD